ncbi:MAG: tetratricopeptide repeat protein [Bacteroidales bacterium]|nr:tetratricopeptide repeat protein [Bacteroidales bacterium]
MANTEKLGDSRANQEKENARKTANTDKLGASRMEGEQEEGHGFMAWYRRNEKIINIIFIAVIVAALLIFAFFKFYLEPQNEKASTEAQPMIDTLVQGGMMTTDTAVIKAAVEGDEGFLAVAEAHKMSKAAKFSLKYYSAISYLRMGKADEAMDMLLSMKKKDDYLWYEAQMLIGDLYDDKGEVDNAKKYYEKAVDGETGLVAPVALWKLGMLCEREGNWAEAYEYYQKVKDDYFERYQMMGVDKYLERAKIKAGK